MDGNQKAKPSIALWAPCLWLLISSIRGTVLPMVETREYAEGHPYPIILTVLMVLGGVILYRRRFNVLAFVKENKLIVLLYCLMGVSILWSSYPWISFRRWVKTIGSLEMVLIVLVELDPLSNFSYVMRRYFCLVIPVSLILIFLVPSLGLRAYPDGTISWVGLFVNRNSLARTAMIFCVYFVWSLTQKEQERNILVDSFFLFLSLAALVGSRSTTSLLGFILSLGIFSLIALGRNDVRLTGVTVVYILGLGAVFLFLFESVLLREPVVIQVIRGLGKETTLTGRTELWSDLWEIGLKQPFLGHGFGGFWVSGNPPVISLWEKRFWTAHNGYMAVFLETGILGLGIVLLLIVNTYRRISRSFVTRFEYARLRTVILLTLVLHNFGETSLCNLNDPLWFLFLFSTAFMPSPFPQVRRGPGLVMSDHGGASESLA